MKHRLARCLALLVGVVVMVSPHPADARSAAPRARVASSRAVRADSLFRSARARLAAGTFDERRLAIRDLDEAVMLAPDDARMHLALGEACLDARFERKARLCFLRAAGLDPRDGRPHLGLGRAWKREWLVNLERPSLDHAVEELIAATQRDPSLGDAWVLLAPLLYENDDEAAALGAAHRGAETCPGRADVKLTAAYLDFRDGRIAHAESLFREAIPLLPPAWRGRFGDLTPLLPRDLGDQVVELTPRMQGEFTRRFWSEADPDPTTPENEAQLEYWARVAHACLIYLQPDDPHWDQRAELYVRYGPPNRAIYELAGMPLTQRPGSLPPAIGYDRYGGAHQIGMQMYYPKRTQVLDYSHLGMLVQLSDITLSGDFRLPMSMFPVNLRPDRRTLARSDLIAMADGEALFPALPPRVKPLAVRGGILRFEGVSGTKLLAQIETPGSPEDSIWAQCVVTDSSEHVVARAGRVLSPSGCDPTELRTGDFTFDLPPSIYRIVFSVRDGHGARGLARTVQVVEPVPGELALSDLAVVCGPIDVDRNTPEIRLGPNLQARVTGAGPLVAYFEIYRLTAGADGLAHFAYEYSVESEDRAPGPWYKRMLPFGGEPHYVVKSEEAHLGALRRQFITVPMRSLKPGRYRLDVKVRDLTSRTTATASARFEHVGGAGAGG